MMCIQGQVVFGQGQAIRCVPRSVTPGPSYSGGYSYHYPRSYSSTYSSGYGTINGETVYNTSNGTVNGVPTQGNNFPVLPQMNRFPVQAKGNGFPGLAQGGPATRTSTSTDASVSRSVSFKKDGKRVSIRETPAGITAKIGGKTIRAKDLEDLKYKSPEAYDLYNDRMGSTFAKASASAKGIAGGGAGGGSGVGPGNMVVDTEQDSSRSVTVAENGKKITITENDGVITVRSGRQVVRAKNQAELGKKSPEALRLYKEHFTEGAPAMQAPAVQGTARQNPGMPANGGPGFGNNARDMLRDQINQMRDENAGNAQMQGMFDRMMQQIDDQ